MSSLRILSKDYPCRSLALATHDYALVFQHCNPEPEPTQRRSSVPPRCLVEFINLSSEDLEGYRLLGNGYGTLGLVTLDEDVFLCVVTESSRAATPRPGETVSRIDNVDFFCLNRSEYEDGLEYTFQSSLAADDSSYGTGAEGRELITDHPFLALKKLVGDGTFYYSLDFNLTDRLQDRSDKSAAFDIESLKEDMLWNSYMIHPLLSFRNRLSSLEKERLDSSQILTCVIRGFASTLVLPGSVQIISSPKPHHTASISIISRQSSRRAGTRFNSRGIDDDGHVANFVETEFILWIPIGITFSYVQIRGSVPIFWEQSPGFLPGQQKIEITRSSEATQFAFNKHFERLELEYGAIHIVNLLSKLKPGEAELSAEFREQITRSSLNHKAGFDMLSDHALLRVTEFDFHAESRGPLGYGASDQIRNEISRPLHGFAYFLSEDAVATSNNQPQSSSVRLQQEGVFRTNCLDCLDRTNLVQTIISSMSLESFLIQQGGKLDSEIQLRHSSLWADNGDALSKIYAGTGALKSSFTRHGKMSIAGALADARKTATRLYVNNFSDKARQKTIDLLLGRLADQVPVYLYDPVNDLVSEELDRRASEYSFTKPIKIWAGTFNVNGRHQGPNLDLSPWLLSGLCRQDDTPTIFAVGFQEIVPLSPQQIMSTDPTTRKVWEYAVKNCLNKYADSRESANYVLLRSGQLVGTALMVYVREDALNDIKNVEGSVKKTGLSGMAGNKGGCAIRFDYSNTRLCFVTAHLASGFANYDERNSDYETICHGLRFQKNKSIEDHDAIVWLGDFNYRIGRNNQEVRELVAHKDFARLYDNDQLNLQMLAGRAFQFYTEGPITFPPTYKYDIGRDDYDSSDKARIPAWCDRILWKGPGLRQVSYQTANLRFSDHRPVSAIFSCVISIVDEITKSEIRNFLYDKGIGDLHGEVIHPVNRRSPLKENVISLQSIVPGLPPASSDNFKWWLDNGTPVRSSVKPPANGFVLNLLRESNPFSKTGDPDWAKMTECQSHSRQDQPSDGIYQPPVLPPRVKPVDMPYRLGPTSQTSDLLKVGQDVIYNRPSIIEKPAPPIPRKPVSLAYNRSDSGSPKVPIQQTSPVQLRTSVEQHIDNQGGATARGQGAVRSATSAPQVAAKYRTNSGQGRSDSTRMQYDSLLDENICSVKQPAKSTGDAQDLLDGTLRDKIDWRPLTPQ